MGRFADDGGALIALEGRRRTVPVATRVDFWLDLALTLAYLADYSFRLTGLAVHEWIGLGLGLALLVHITVHWEWAVRTSQRILASIPGRERMRWGVDLALLLVMVLCVASGVLVSRSALPAIGVHPSGTDFWNGLHTTSADVTVVLVGVHVALNWKWIVTVAGRVMRPRRGLVETRVE